jgi:hypothetical protein
MKNFTEITDSPLIPKGASFGRVRMFEFAVRTIVDYDTSYMSDRLVTTTYISGVPTGHYSTVMDTSSLGLAGGGLLGEFGDMTERRVIDALLELGYEKELREREETIRHLVEFMNRPRWYHFPRVRREWRIFRLRLSELIAPPMTRGDS